MNDMLAGFFGALLGGEDLSEAACRGRWELFDNTDDPVVIAEAVETCQQCPVLERCRDWADGLPDSHVTGVVAGELRTWVSHPSARRRSA
jgi:hypothetical protein